ncbi:MAG: hypothetical protein MZU97_12470 [Bacillus subtilis]|nr:hypothetical protein [Bacillus subtilis]
MQDAYSGATRSGSGYDVGETLHAYSRSMDGTSAPRIAVPLNTPGRSRMTLLVCTPGKAFAARLRAL